jgi:hypothetical protein
VGGGVLPVGGGVLPVPHAEPPPPPSLPLIDKREATLNRKLEKVQDSKVKGFFTYLREPFLLLLLLLQLNNKQPNVFYHFVIGHIGRNISSHQASEGSHIASSCKKGKDLRGLERKD